MNILRKYVWTILFSCSIAYGQTEKFTDSTDQPLIHLGYSQQSEDMFSGSVFSLESQSFAQGLITDPMQLIRGKIPGLGVLKAGGDPNEAFELRLRGLNSVESSTLPLIVIDGFPTANYQSIDPEDIERITVLRDAASSAVYGIRSANGIILIETKKGKEGKLSLNYHTQLVTSSVANKPEVLNAEEYNALRNQLNNTNRFPFIEDFGDADNDWQQEIQRNTTFSQMHHLSGAGSVKNTQYRASATIRDVHGVIQKSGYNQLNLKGNLSQSFWKNRIKIALQGILNQRRTENFNYDFFAENGFERINHVNAPLYFATRMIPEMPIMDNQMPEYGGYYQPYIYDLQNPVAILNQVTNENRIKNRIGQTRGSIEIIKGLTLNGSFSVQQRVYGKGYQSGKEAYHFNGLGYAILQQNANFRRFYDVHLDYSKKIGNHQVSVVTGHSYEYQRQRIRKSVVDMIPSNEFSYTDLANDSIFSNNLDANIIYHAESRKIAAFFGLVNYELEDKISAQFSLRHEGASNLGANQKWGLFPAGSIGVNWLSLLNQQGLFKTRLSYGLTGNLPRDNYRSQYLVSGIGYNFYYNGQYIEIKDIIREGNPNLSWEKTRGWDLGFDIGIKDGLLQLSVDFYGQKTTDLIQNINLPVVGSAFSRVFTFNAGALNSNGLELSLTNRLFKQNPDFSIENRFILGRARTWLVTLDSEYEDFPDKRLIGDHSNGPGRWFPAIYLRDNKPVGEFWGYIYQGINADGEWIFKDINGGGFNFLEEDFDYIGNALPRSLWSWSSFIELKNFSVDFQLTGVSGHSILNTYRYYYEILYSMGGNNLLQSTTVRPVSRLQDFAQLSDFYVEKASYARMDYMKLSYEWPSNSKWYSHLGIYLLSQNLFTITGYRGVDPEARLNSQGNPLVPGIELRNTYFPVRNWAVGVKIKL